MADAGMVANVVVQDITRLFRSVREALNEFDRLEAKGVRFHSAVEQIDASTPDGELMRTFKLALGQHERRRLGERTARVLRATKQAKTGTGRPGVESKALRGKLMVGQPPFGFKWVRKTAPPGGIRRSSCRSYNAARRGRPPGKFSVG